MIFSTLTILKFLELETWAKEVNKDDRLSKIIRDLLVNSISHPRYFLQGNKLFFKGKLVLPRTSSQILILLVEFHNSLIGGHFGFFRTYKRLIAIVYWEGMKCDVHKFVLECDTC